MSFKLEVDFVTDQPGKETIVNCHSDSLEQPERILCCVYLVSPFKSGIGAYDNINFFTFGKYRSSVRFFVIIQITSKT